MESNEIQQHKKDRSAAHADPQPIMPQRSWTELTWAVGVDGLVEWIDRRGFQSIVEPVVGQRWQDVVHADDRDSVQESWARATTAGTVFESEHRLPLCDGEYRWFLARAWPLRDRNGRVIRWFGSSSDIEDVKQAERASTETERQIDHEMAALVSLGGHGADLELAHLVDFRLLQPLMDALYCQDVATSIQDTHGVHYAASSWQRICADFHRANKTMRQRCVESDAKLLDGIPPGQWRIHQCKNNLWEIAAPIVVNGSTIGTVMIGQFFLEGTEPDREAFRSQARRHGFDEDEYLAAFDEVPRFSRERIERSASLITALSNLIAGLCYKQIRLDRTLAQYEAAAQYLRTQQQIGKHVEATAGLGSWQLGVASGSVHLSEQACSVLGIPGSPSYPVGDILEVIHPQDVQAVESAFMTRGPDPVDIECRISTGEPRLIHARAWREWDATGQLTSATGTVRDVAGRAQKPSDGVADPVTSVAAPRQSQEESL